MGDGIVGITWMPIFGVNYMAFTSTNPTLTTDNWTDPGIGGFAVLNGGTSSVPPALLCSSFPGQAVNGLPYYFTVDAHTGTSPGGAGSPTVMALARSAGGNGTWRVGTPMGTNLNGVGYATITPCEPNSLPTGVYAAVGPVGAIFTSPDGKTWSSRTPVGYSTDLFAVATNTIFGIPPNPPSLLFVAVGSGGAVVRSTDGVTWTATVATNASLPTLRAIAVATGVFVAVGDNGRIQTSIDGVSWTVRPSNTTVNLHAINCTGTICVAAGDSAVVEISFDSGNTWGEQSLGTSGVALRAVAYGNFDNNETGTNVVGVDGTTAINTWVVVGDGGTAYAGNTIVSSASAIWNPVPISGAGNLIAVSYTTQFVAVDNSGNAFTSQIAVTWSPPVATGIGDPVSMTTNQHGFVLAGSSGDNTSSF